MSNHLLWLPLLAFNICTSLSLSYIYFIHILHGFVSFNLIDIVFRVCACVRSKQVEAIFKSFTSVWVCQFVDWEEADRVCGCALYKWHYYCYIIPFCQSKFFHSSDFASVSLSICIVFQSVFPGPSLSPATVSLTLSSHFFFLCQLLFSWCVNVRVSYHLGVRSICMCPH